MARRDTQEDFIRKANEKYPDGNYTYEKVVYKGSKVKVTITCSEHGDFDQTPGNFLNAGKGCPTCGWARVKLSWEDFLERANKTHSNKFTYSKPTGDFGVRDSVKITCPEHGDFYQRINDHLNLGYGCKKCASENLVKYVTKEEFITQAEEVHGQRYLYHKLPETMGRLFSTKGTFVCTEHGSFRQTYGKHLKGQGCPKCAVDVVPRKVDLDYIRKKAQEVHGDKYEYLSFERGGSYMVTYRCQDHGEYTQSFYSHLSGIGCGICSKAVSTQHKKIMAWLDEWGIDYHVNDRTVLKPQELDIYIPKHKLAIEINGEYFHTLNMVKDRFYHYNKFIGCEAQGIRLVQFWGGEVDSKPELVQSMLRNYLGLIRNRVYARKCKVAPIDPPIYRSFLEENHLEGKRGSSIRLGLFHDDELVSVMGFTKINGGFELDRYCSLKGTVVVGAFSKLLKQAPKGTITSYSYNRYSLGNIYSTNGFKFTRENKASLFYLHQGKLKNRNGFMKYKLRQKLGVPDSDPRKERELAEEIGAFQVFDAGTRTWVLDNQ